MSLSFWDELIPQAVAFARQQPDHPRVRLLTIEGDAHQVGLHVVATHLLADQIPATRHLEIPATDIPELLNPGIEAVLISGLLETGFISLIPVFAALNQRHINVPFILGGGMLTEAFVAQKLVPHYQGPIYFAKRPELAIPIIQAIFEKKLPQPVQAQFVKVSTEITVSIEEFNYSSAPIPEIRDFELKTNEAETVDTLWPWISSRAFYQLHLKFPGNFEKAFNEKNEDAIRLYERVEALKDKIRLYPQICHPKAIWQYFSVKSLGNDVLIYRGAELIDKITFPRQSKSPYLSLADWVSPVQDVIPFFATTITGAKEMAEVWFSQGNISDALLLQHIACQLAEGLAEKLHAQLRHQMAISKFALLSESDIEHANYQGRRYSFGYAACPDLAGQKILFNLLKPEKIGLNLSDIYMMTPEASVSAMVFHHPNATYFGISSQ